MTIGTAAAPRRHVQSAPPADPGVARALADHLIELDAREASLSRTQAVTGTPEAREAGADLGRHFAADGLLLVRKALIARIEAWLSSAARPTGRGPLAAGARVFDRWRGDPSAAVRWRERLLLRGLWLGVAVRALAMPMTRGITFRRAAYLVGVPNKWGPERPDALHHDLIAVNRRRFRPGDVAVLAVGDAFVGAYRALGHPVLRVKRSPVPIGIWLFDVCPRLARLIWRRTRADASSASGWLASFAAWEIAWRSLDWEAVAGAAAIRVITDVEEQNPEHAIKTAVFGRRGGLTLRVPHTQPDTPGNHTAFWMYHVVAVSNAYLPRVYGSTWWDRSRVEPVGLIFNSHGPSDEGPAAERLRELEGDGPILALFTGSHIGVQPLIHEALVRVAARALRDHVSLRLVIKPKPTHTDFLEHAPYRELLGPFAAAGRVTILHPSALWCSAQTLLERATACLTYGGSVVTEALALGTPVVVYQTVPGHNTPWVDAFRGSVIVDDEEAAAARLAEIVGGRAPAIDEALLRDTCDGFLDRDALERLTRLVDRLVAA